MHFYQPPVESNMGVVSMIVAIVVSISLLALIALIVVYRCRVARRRQVAIMRIVHGSGQHRFGLIPDWDRRVPQVFKEQYMFNSLLMPARVKGSKQALDEAPLVNEVREFNRTPSEFLFTDEQIGWYSQQFTRGAQTEWNLLRCVQTVHRASC